MTTALYARTSTSKQDSGLEAQILQLSKYCNENQIDEFEVYKDSGISGTKERRPELDRLIKDCREGRIKTVVVYSFSRMGRSTQHLLKTLNFFEDHEINFISLSESLDTTTAMGKCLFGIISAISQMEADLISERVKAGLENAASKGRFPGAPRQVNEELVNELLQSEKYSYSEIARLAKCSKSSVFRVAQKRSKNV